jgi:hypothetical protein
MSGDVGELIERFRTDPNASFSDDELAVLDDAASADLWAAKIAGYHHFRRRNLPQAALLMTRVAAREPTTENIINLVVLHRDAGNLDAAVAVLEARRDELDPIRFHDMMCSCLGHYGRLDDARRHGTEALRLKDESAPAVPPRSFQLSAVDLDNPARQVLAFSLFGADQRYILGAINNCVVARYLYPGWTPRFFVDASVPDEARRLLAQNGGQVVTVNGLPAADYGLFWRFLVEDDANVGIYVVRDADSVITVKERAAVAAWLRSGRAFHVMRDNIQHSELMLAGMWGAHRGNLGPMTPKLRDFVAGIGVRANCVHRDQHFLRSEIWPIVRQSVFVNDEQFSFGEVHAYDPDYALPRAMHIGQNDWVHYRRRG